jgi:hypothetical protein
VEFKRSLMYVNQPGGACYATYCSLTNRVTSVVLLWRSYPQISPVLTRIAGGSSKRYSAFRAALEQSDRSRATSA